MPKSKPQELTPGQARVQKLLQVRPDLAYQMPGQLDQLKGEAEEGDSLIHCLNHLNRTDYEVLGVLMACGALTVEQLEHHSSLNQQLLDESLGRLSDRWLVHFDGTKWRTERLDAIEMFYPIGLGPSFKHVTRGSNLSDLNTVLSVLVGKRVSNRSDAVMVLTVLMSDVERVTALAASSPATVRTLLEQLVDVSPTVKSTYQSSRNQSNATIDWLVSHGVLFQTLWNQWTMPAEVGIALRGGRALLHGASTEPKIKTSTQSSHISQTVLIASALVANINNVCQYIEMSKPKALVSGGLGVKEVKALYEDLRIDETLAAFLLELANAAGLIDAQTYSVEVASRHGSRTTMRSEQNIRFRSTKLAQTVFDSQIGEQWVGLARTWLLAETHLSTAGKRDEDGKRKNVLSESFGYVRSLEDVSCQRYELLSSLAEAGEGQAFESIENFIEYLRWHSYQLFSDEEDTFIEELIHEAQLLSLCEGLSLTELGAHLIGANFDAAAAKVTEFAVPPVDEFMVQADGSIMVAGTPSATLLADLRAFTDVESIDAAMILRINETSLRRAFDAGKKSDDLIQFLSDKSIREVPQAVDYLIRDVERRYGNVVVGTAMSFIQTDDPVLMADIVRNKAMTKLGLKQLAPTVAVSDIEPNRLLTELQKASFMPRLDQGVLKVVGESIDDRPIGRSVSNSAISAHLRLVDTAALAQQIVDAEEEPTDA